MRRIAVLSGLLVASLVEAAPAVAVELYCLADAKLNWIVSPPVLSGPAVTTDRLGQAEFWIDTEAGEWRYRTIGSRALYSDGGRLTILADGSGYRQHWVGSEDHGGFASLRIDLTRQPIRFLRADRDGFIETGACVETAGRTFIDGVERPQ